MKIAVDSCSVILLAKSTVLEHLSKSYELVITEEVYKEVLKGKDKKLIDALLTERLVKENKINKNKAASSKLAEKLMLDFGLGKGEAETIALVLGEQCDIIITDNRQGRKVAQLYGLNLSGSIDAIVALCKLKILDKNKAMDGLSKLKEFGWFHAYLIDSALEEIKND